jgi:hypothetical protein
MAWVIFSSKEAADEVQVTPDLEGGIGPVMLGDGIQAVDGRIAYCHGWNEVSLDWMTGYGGTVVDELPKDFVVKSEKLM